VSFSPDETRRYARHLVLKGVGGTGQQKLRSARVLVIGAGGLGAPVIAYLVGAGIGTLGVVDDDTVSLSNLQRQVIHTTATNGEPKSASARSFAQALNPHVTLVEHRLRLDEANAPGLLANYDLVVEGSDNLPTRRAVAAAAEASGKPMVSGAVSMFDGQVTTFLPGGPRLVDLYGDMDDADLPNCEMTGILGPVTGVVGTLMAMEVLKLVTGVGEPLAGRVLLYDGRAARFSEFSYGAIAPA
jgi:molybdopterin/thiamine biosynthesis adenylyltransferase